MRTVAALVVRLPVVRLPVVRLPVVRLPVVRLPVVRLPVAGLLVAGLLVAGSAGCAVSQAAEKQAPAIAASNGYLPLPATPGVTLGYLAIRNNGPADRLISARISTGGRVSFAAAAGQSMPWIAVPAHSLVRLVPDGPHLLITGTGRLRGGQAVTLTLVFSRGGRVNVQAVVSNPAAGGLFY